MSRLSNRSHDSLYSDGEEIDIDSDQDTSRSLNSKINSRLSTYENNNNKYTPPKRSESLISKTDSRSTYSHKDDKVKWVDINTKNSLPPSDYTVTHVNQTYDYLRLGEMNAAFHMNQNSKEWLKSHGIEFLKLTLKDLLQQGTVTKPISDKSGKAVQHITFDATVLNEFEYKLNLALEMFSKRIKWLMQSSRKAFGLIEGDNVGIIVDSSTANLGFGRSVELLDSLISLVNEQLCHKKQFYMASFGTDVNELWDLNLKDAHHRTLEEAKVFVSHMRQSGGCNLLQALKRVIKVKNLDSIVIILGSVPDQNMDIILDYAQQAILNKSFTFHCVAYELTNHIVNTSLKKLADETNGRFHCYSTSQEYLIYNSSDIQIILKEIHRVQDILARVKDMRHGLLGSAIIRIENEIQLEMEKYPPAKFLPRPRGHDLPLKFEQSNVSIKTSGEWLKENGLKAKKLNLYQILAPNAYSPIEDFIPILKKTVQSTVHERVMAQFTWHDGTIKNLHVDFATLFEYQKQLGSIVKLYEKRIDWLASGSRKIFGAINEEIVVVLIDLSTSNSKYLIHIQHSLRLLMEQQILNKKFFNIIGFGRTIQKWKPTVIKPTEKNLQEAWRWVLDLQCDGTRNTLGALKAALENEEERKHKIEVDGIYLFTSGIPDQPINICCAYIEEASCGRNLKVHTILFNVDDYDGNGAIPGRWANITKTAEALRSLAHCIHNGRFHWFRETGIIENDDIKLVRDEIDKALFFSKKAADLVDSFHRRRYGDICYDREMEAIESIQPRQAITNGSSISVPKQTALSMQRINMREKENEESKVKALPWRPHSSVYDSSSRSEFSVKQRRGSVDVSQTRNTTTPFKRTKSARSITQSFYIDGKSNDKGSVFRKYPKQKSVRKDIPVAAIPEREEIVTSKDWLRKYSLGKLRLDLHKLVSGPDCKHDVVTVGTLKKDVSARYCAIFPSININGVVRHLQLRQGELKEYAEQCEKIVKRYVKRLQWLLTGSRRAFGTVTHDKIAILIDTSGSMDEHIFELKRELAFLLWEQICKQKVSFNIVRFSNGCAKWRDCITQATEENCHKAIAWLATSTAYGNTCTLDALKIAFDDKDINGVYLITDGKPDSSTTYVLEEVRKLNSTRRLSINVVSFNCEEKSANDFMRQLANENYGRYHKPCKNDRDIHVYAQKILTEGVNDSYLSHIPDFESDDLKLLSGEIKKAKEFLKQAITFSNLYDKRDEIAEEVFIGPIRLNSVRDQEVRHKECKTVDFMR